MQKKDYYETRRYKIFASVESILILVQTALLLVYVFANPTGLFKVILSIFVFLMATYLIAYNFTMAYFAYTVRRRRADARNIEEKEAAKPAPQAEPVQAKVPAVKAPAAKKPAAKK